MTASKPRRGTVGVEREGAIVTATKAAHARTTLEVTWPALMARVHSDITGTDLCVAAGGGIGLPGTPTGNAWLTTLAQEHGSKLITLDAHLVRHVVENGTSLDRLVTDLKRVAADTGAHVLVVDDTRPQPEPLPPVDHRPLGTIVAEDFVVGEVHNVPPSRMASMPDVLACVGREATTISYNGPDRLVAQRHGSAERSVYNIFRPDEPCSAWLVGVVLAHEPLLLIVDPETVRTGVDLNAIARDQRVAVAVLPGPVDRGHITPESIKEATDG